MLAGIRRLTPLIVATLGFPVPAAHAADVRDALTAIDDGMRDRFGIRVERWVEASGSLPAHAFLAGCHDCGGARYDATGALVNAGELSSAPTSYVLRVPENYAGKLVIVVPPGASPHTFFRPNHQMLIADGYAVAVVDHPAPGFPGFEFERTWRPGTTKEIGTSYAATAHMLRDLAAALGGGVAAAYGLANSRGVILGLGLLAGRAGGAIDGFVLVSGGDGVLGDLLDSAASLSTDGLVPLTGLPSLVASFPIEEIEAGYADTIGLADPEYRSSVLAGDASILDYDPAARPAHVQRRWDELAFGTDLQAPVIIIQGLRDTTVFPGGTLRHAQAIADAGAAGRLRMYLVKGMGHAPFDPPAPPQAMFREAVGLVDAWVTTGVPPGDLQTHGFGLQPSCHALGFGADAFGCFGAVFGSGF